jgi:hypothetical protein
MEVPRTVPLARVFAGIIIAALAEAMQVRAANESSDRLGDVVATYGQTLSAFGQITAAAASGQAGDSAEIMFPPALLRRASRYIGNAADLAANGGKLPDGVPEAARDVLANAAASARKRDIINQTPQRKTRTSNRAPGTAAKDVIHAGTDARLHVIPAGSVSSLSSGRAPQRAPRNSPGHAARP